MEKKFDRSSLMKVLWKLMLPIVLQNLLSAVVSTADVLMLTHVSQAALSASSLAGQVTFVLTLFYFGLSTGASVLVAQYWGKGDAETISRVQGLSLRYSCAVSFLFFLAALLMPERLMGIFTQDELLIAYGAGYLRFVSVSYLMMTWPGRPRRKTSGSLPPAFAEGNRGRSSYSSSFPKTDIQSWPVQKDMLRKAVPISGRPIPSVFPSRAAAVKAVRIRRHATQRSKPAQRYSSFPLAHWHIRRRLSEGRMMMR